MGKGKQKIFEANNNKLNFTPSMIREPTFHPFMPSEKIDGKGVRDRLGRKFSIEGFVTYSEADNHTKDSGKRACVIKQEELDLLKVTYDIPNIADPRLPNPNDKPSYHFNGCVTYFSIVLRLGLGSVYSLALFAFGCGFSKPTIEDVKHLYQLKSNPKDASWALIELGGFIDSGNIHIPSCSCPPVAFTKAACKNLLSPFSLVSSRVAEGWSLSKKFWECKRESELIQRLEENNNSFRGHIKSLEKEVDDNYNTGIEYCYNCILVILENSHPELKLDDLSGLTLNA
ncbi:hypothetical protein WN943_003662 [Citrus x changshan-huyou]